MNIVTAARAEALFVSTVQRADPITRIGADAAISLALRSHGGTHGCAGDVAAAYGRHPVSASQRMLWALDVVETLYPPRVCGCPTAKLRLHQEVGSPVVA